MSNYETGNESRNENSNESCDERIDGNRSPGKLEVLSFPGSDRCISDESIQALQMVATRYRNRRIGEFLKELLLVEGRNTSVPSVLCALEDNGSPPPLF